MHVITKYIFLKNQNEIKIFLDLVKNKHDTLEGYKIANYKLHAIHKGIIKIRIVESKNYRVLSCERHDYSENIVKDFENEIMTIEEYGDL